jgi:hypothetical protein
MATGVQSWSKTAANNATADSTVNWAEGMSPSAVNDSARAEMASVAKWRDDISGTVTTGGSSTAYTITTNQSFASASAMSGAKLCFIPHTTSGASPTLAVDGLTARAINYSTGVAVPTGALIQGTPYLVTYIHASTEFILIGAVGVDGATGQLSKLDINGGTAETAPAVGDFVPLYDLSATANRKMTLANLLKVINDLTAETTPATDDLIALYDTSGGTTDKMTLANLAKVWTAPTRQYLTSGTAATYTTPAGAKTLIVKMIGGGGGGGGSGTSDQDGGAGGTTSFNSIEAAGGSGGVQEASGGAGGAGGTGGTGSASLRLNGSAGGRAIGIDNTNGGNGAPGLFGLGAGLSGTSGGSGSAGATNTGAGGGGAGFDGPGSANGAGGGGSGEYVEIVITSPSATYTYTVGAAGAAGTGSRNGGAGGSGLIIVEEYY